MKFLTSGMLIVLLLVLTGCPKTEPRRLQQPEAADAAGPGATQQTDTAQAQSANQADGASNESSHRKAVRELFRLTNASDLTESMNAQMKQMMLQQIRQEKIPIGKKPIVEKYMARLMDLIADTMDWSQLEGEFADLYVANFSENEINDMLAFYKSPTGRKMIETMPAIMKASMAIGQKQAQRLMPKVRQVLDEMQKEIERG